MAKIPDVYERTIPTARGQIVPLRPNAMGGVQNLAEGLNTINRAQQQAEDEHAQFDEARAESSLLAAHATALGELEGDNYQDYTSSYQKRMEEARTNASLLIQNPRARARFQLRADNQILQGSIKAEELAQAKEGDIGRGNLVDALADNRKHALAATGGDRVGFITNSQRLIQGARQRNYVDAEAAAKLSQSVGEDYAMAIVEQLPPGERIHLLSGKSSTELDLTNQYNTKLSPEQETAYQGWLKTLSAKQRNTYDYDLRGAFKAGIQPNADGHFPDTYKKPNHPTFSNESQYANAQHPGGSWEGDTYVPPKQLLDFIPKDKQDILLERAQAELVAQQNAYEKARKDQLDRDKVTASNIIWDEQGKNGVNSIPVETWGQMNEAEKKSMIGFSEYLSKGEDPPLDLPTYYELKGMPEDEFKNVNLLEYKDKLDISTFTKLTDLQSGIRNRDEGARQELGTSRSDEDFINSNLYILGINPQDVKDDEKLATRVNRFKQMFDESLFQTRQRLGRKNLSPDEMDKVLGDLVRQVHKPGWKFLGMEFGEDDKPRFDYTLEDVPEADAAAIRKMYPLAHQGRMPTDQDVVDTYVRQLQITK